MKDKEIEADGFITVHPPIVNGYVAMPCAPQRRYDEVSPSAGIVPSYEEQRTEQEAKGVAMRFNAGKLRFDLVPPDVIEILVRIYTMGAAKYADRNWEKGFDWMSCCASLERHLNDWKKGIDRDPESGELHMGHVMWNAAALVAFQLRGVGKDDRVKLI